MAADLPLQKIKKTRLIIRHQDPKFLTPALQKFRVKYLRELQEKLSEQLQKLH
ncbi:MAG: hypothetical protein AB7C90_01765 [Bacteroidales bacterium]